MSRPTHGAPGASALRLALGARAPRRAAGGATAQASKASKAADEVVEGAKKVGKGVEETAKGIGKTVTEGAKEVGQRAEGGRQGVQARGRQACTTAPRASASRSGTG